MKQYSVIFHFYKHYLAPAGMTVSLFGWYYIFNHGGGIIPLLLIVRTFLFGVIYVAQAFQKSDKMLYYYNLHLSKTALWSFAVFIDVILFLFIAALIIHLR